MLTENRWNRVLLLWAFLIGREEKQMRVDFFSDEFFDDVADAPSPFLTRLLTFLLHPQLHPSTLSTNTDNNNAFHLGVAFVLAIITCLVAA